MDIKEIFENMLKIEPKVVSIESLFNNPERVANTNYSPSYQRNYVWDDEKATYFIESILLGTEIPPLIYFRNRDKVEVIDGRQRYETILRFIKNIFKLKKNGLQKLDNIGIANKVFEDIGMHYQDLFWDTKLRIIEFSFHSPQIVSEEMEDSVKREIFKRYNSGITPLKPTEIDKAFYFEDDLNSYLKSKIQSDQILYRDLKNILHFEKTNDEIILKKIRQLLVQHRIPIKYYAVKKDTIISKYYEYLFANVDEDTVDVAFTSFITKINLITRIKAAFPNPTVYNRLITECLFWTFSIMEVEDIQLSAMTDQLIVSLVAYLNLKIAVFSTVNHSFSKELFTRYETTAGWFSNIFKIDFNIYLYTSGEFKKENRDLDLSDSTATSFDDLRINKPEPTSTAIMDISRQMERQRFLIRPPYQRDEVINKKKSSSIIESILLGIKLPPIFVYKRKDGISEVLDGQQRLLSILGFINKPYLDENNKLKHSNKEGYPLSLKNGILHNLTGKKFAQLEPEQQEKIRNFDLWVIEISHVNNANFEPIDLFIRLNNKPYPIKEDTFELWNSYISREIIDTIKLVRDHYKDWFYIRKNNSRMENENFCTTLAYFQLCKNKSSSKKHTILKELDIYQVGAKMNFRVKSKNEITKVLESAESKDDFITAINELEFGYIRKLRTLLADNEELPVILNKNLDEIFRIENGKRTQQGFWALWHFLSDIPLSEIMQQKMEIRQELRELFGLMNFCNSKKSFDKAVADFKDKFQTANATEVFFNSHEIASLGEIVTGATGTSVNHHTKAAPIKSTVPYLKKGEFINFHFGPESLDTIETERLPKPFYLLPRGKILISKHNFELEQLSVAFFEGRLAFGPDIIGLTIIRQGLLPKYVLAILSNRMIFRSFLRSNKIGVEDTKSITLNDLAGIPVPIIPVKQQQVFASLVDYVFYSSKVNKQSLYFEQLLETLIAELFFPEKFKRQGIELALKLNDLPSLVGLNVEDQQVSIERAHRQLSDPTHPVSAELLNFVASGSTFSAL